MIRPHACRAERGFGLLEAIVAMVILGSAGLLLFSWIQQSLESASRIRSVERRAAMQLEAQEYLSRINPGQRPNGRETLPGLLLEWTAELVEPMRNEYDYAGNLQPRWQVGLFRLKVKVSRDGDSAEWSQLQAGWTQLGMASVDEGKPR